MEIRKVPIEQVEPWEDNPWDVKTEDFVRLKEQIKDLQPYKPLICFWDENKRKWIVIGGNKRLYAYKELGYTEVDISIIKPETEARKLEYVFSDNDRVGIPDTQKIAEIITPYLTEIKLENFKIDIAEPINLKQIFEQYGPEENGQESNIPKLLYCPHCGGSFTYKEAKQEGKE